METATKIQSDIRVVAIDETQHWNDEMKEKCGKIETVYIYDANVQTNCCEVTPSYYLEPLYYNIENEVSDEVHEQVQSELVNDEGNYFNCRFIDQLKSIEVPIDSIEFETSESEEYKEHYEEAKEYSNCNHLI